MPIDAQKLAAAVNKRLAPAYLLAGDEPLLIDEAMDAIRVAARNQGFDEREVLHRERGNSVEAIQSACASGSLFSTRRIVELQCGSQAPDAKLGAFLKDYLARPPEDLLLLVRCGALDGRQRNSAWAKAFEAIGGFVYVWPMRPAELGRWAAARLSAAGLGAERDALDLLVERTEGNLMALAQDIEKLKLLHAEGARLGVAEIHEAVADSSHIDTFDWIARVLAGDAKGAARGLWRLREQGEALPAIVAALAWNLRQLASAAERHAAGEDLQSVFRRLRIPRPRQGAMGRALERARLGQVLSWQARLADIDARAKRSEEQLAWEALLTCALAMAGRSLAGRGAPA